MFENEGQKTRVMDLAEEIVLTEETIKRLGKEVVAKRAEIIAVMQQSGQLSGGYDNKLKPRLETQLKISKWGSVEDSDLHCWLAENDLADIIKPFVHAGTLQSTLVKFIAKGNTLPPDMFNQFEKTVVRMNGRADFLRELTTNTTKGTKC